MRPARKDVRLAAVRVWRVVAAVWSCDGKPIARNNFPSFSDIAWRMWSRLIELDEVWQS